MSIPLKLMVATSRLEKIAGLDLKNGAVSRMLAWKSLINSVRFVDVANVGIKDEFDFCIIDLTGERLVTCVRAWRNWRHRKPVCFLQDSQVRYNLSGFAAARGWLARSKFVVNGVRGLIREAFCYVAFRRIGYVSSADFLIAWKSHELRALASTIRVAKENIPPNLRISYLRMIGNYSYGPNRDGIVRMLEEPAFCEVLTRLGLKVILSGHLAESIADVLDGKFVEKSLCGQFEELADIARPDQILICPAFYGSGIKNKIVEGQVINNFTLAWRGFAKEFPYSPDLTDYFDDVVDLSAYISFICTRIASDTAPVSFFQLAEEYRFMKFLGALEEPQAARSLRIKR